MSSVSPELQYEKTAELLKIFVPIGKGHSSTVYIACPSIIVMCLHCFTIMMPQTDRSLIEKVLEGLDILMWTTPHNDPLQLFSDLSNVCMRCLNVEKKVPFTVEIRE